MKKYSINLVLPQCRALLGHSLKKYSNFLALINKSSYKLYYKPQLKYFLDIIKTIFRFLGTPMTPLQTKRRKMKISPMECWVSK
mgnify:CR=1 FL=1